MCLLRVPELLASGPPSGDGSPAAGWSPQALGEGMPSPRCRRSGSPLPLCRSGAKMWVKSRCFGAWRVWAAAHVSA